MKINEFIDNIANSIIKNYNGVEVTYAYESFSDTHFFVICPPDLLEDDSFINLELQFINNFIDSGFSGSLCFLSDKDDILLESPSKISIGSEMNNLEDLYHKKENMTWNISQEFNNVDDDDDNYSLAA